MRHIYILICFCLVMGLSSCVNDLAEVNELFEQTKPGVEVAKDIEILYSDSAIVRIKVISPTLLRHLDPNRLVDEFPDGLHVDFIENDGSVGSTLDAKKGERLNRDKKMIVRDSVVLQNVRNEKLETDELIWDEATAEVYTDKFVIITKPEEIVYAYGFKAKQDFSQYELLQVVGRIKVQDFQNEFKN